MSVAGEGDSLGRAFLEFIQPRLGPEMGSLRVRRQAGRAAKAATRAGKVNAKRRRRFVRAASSILPLSLLKWLRKQKAWGNYGLAGESMPSVLSHVSTRSGHAVMGNFVRRRPNACPPCAYKCISAGTPAFWSAM